MQCSGFNGVKKTSCDMSKDVHPDSKYDNWTIRSYDVKTKIDDIPQWMKIYSESSIDTHDFFQFRRYEYEELNNWQKMLLKLYREDLRKVIKYYEDYRGALVTEIQSRNKSEKEKVNPAPAGGRGTDRHAVCHNNLQKSDSNKNTESFSPALLDVPTSSTTSNHGNTSRDTASSPNTLVKFKRFGNRSPRASHKQDEGSRSTASSPGETTPVPDTMPIYGHVPDPELPDNTHTDTDTDTQAADKTPDKCTDDGFEEPNLKRYIGPGKQKIRSRLYTAWLSENVDRNNTSDFPIPQHNRSASSRPATNKEDFPSPLLGRSASDRPDRYSLHGLLARGVGKTASYSTLSSDDTFTFSRNSSKRSSAGARVLGSPKIKKKTEPGSQHVQYIEDNTDSISTDTVHTDKSTEQNTQITKRNSYVLAITENSLLDLKKPKRKKRSKKRKRSGKESVTASKREQSPELWEDDTTISFTFRTDTMPREPALSTSGLPDPEPASKTKKISKMLSRAASFGRKDRHKVTASPKDKSRETGDRRKSRYEDFLQSKSEVLPKETSV